MHFDLDRFERVERERERERSMHRTERARSLARSLCLFPFLSFPDSIATQTDGRMDGWMDGLVDLLNSQRLKLTLSLFAGERLSMAKLLLTQREGLALHADDDDDAVRLSRHSAVVVVVDTEEEEEKIDR